MPGGRAFGEDVGECVDSSIAFKDTDVKAGVAEIFQLEEVAQLIGGVGFEGGEGLAQGMAGGDFHTAGTAAETEDLSITVNDLVGRPGTDETVGGTDFALEILFFQNIF